jgi:hypothetical protein
MSRTPRPIASEQVIELLLRLIASHRGKPCPTRREIMGWTGLPRREVWPFLKGLAEREPPLLEIEERLHARAGVRRLRLPGGEWTGWTERKTPGREEQAVRRRLKREARRGGA